MGHSGADDQVNAFMAVGSRLRMGDGYVQRKRRKMRWKGHSLPEATEPSFILPHPGWFLPMTTSDTRPDFHRFTNVQAGRFLLQIPSLEILGILGPSVLRPLHSSRNAATQVFVPTRDLA